MEEMEAEGLETGQIRDKLIEDVLSRKHTRNTTRANS
jgi:hypothetical protein